MNVLLAPVVSEKSTCVADKNRQYVFRVADARHQARDQGGGRADVQDQGRLGHGEPNVKGKKKRFGRIDGPPPQLEEGLRAPRRGPGNQLRGDGVSHATDQSQTDLARPPRAGQGGHARPAQGRAALAAASSRRAAAAAATTTAASPCGTRAAATSSTTAIVDFRRDKDGIPATVERLEYDPNRSAHLALLLYADGERRYIIAPKGVTAGTQLMSGAEAPIKPGNTLPLRNIPVGTDGALHRDAAGQGRAARALGRRRACSCWRAKAPTRSCGCARARSARCTSTAAPPSAKSATTSTTCESIGKAGRKRWRGVRPTVRGVAMNPIDHPHGGGEGRTVVGAAPGVAVGRADQGLQDPAQQADAGHDRPRPAREIGIEGNMARSIKKGPFVDHHLHGEGRQGAQHQRQAPDQDLVAPLDDHARLRRPDDRRAQRQAAHAGVRHREHGRAQARRVRADAHLQEPLGGRQAHRGSGRRRAPAAAPGGARRGRAAAAAAAAAAAPAKK